ncbi:hypothetical protein OC846_001904 [Tilletia horrida]|uniref:Smr domain-containing protein n=1 Tax=Tilletia horrida TaxID=155126 RepID=A0AAN6GY21_9BASI|nr:hypothetical protein OC846_001904 [Tilletia horrida]KAK0568335.1 hypothetical protein OC861_002046 [Tilletia horrida]
MSLIRFAKGLLSYVCSAIKALWSLVPRPTPTSPRSDDGARFRNLEEQNQIPNFPGAWLEPPSSNASAPVSEAAEPPEPVRRDPIASSSPTVAEQTPLNQHFKHQKFGHILPSLRASLASSPTENEGQPGNAQNTAPEFTSTGVDGVEEDDDGNDDQSTDELTAGYRYAGPSTELGRTALPYYTSEDYDAMLEGAYDYGSSEEEEPDGELHERLRQYAEHEGSRMAQAFRDATQANRKGNGAAAKKLIKKANHHKAQMEKYKQRAADLIFERKNANRKADEVDLHGLTVAEAESRAQDFVRTAFRRGISEVKLITGKGNHSAGQKAKIKPNVQQLMLQ